MNQQNILALNYLSETKSFFELLTKDVKKLGFDYFSYSRFLNNGSYLFLINNFEIQEKYLLSVRDAGITVSHKLFMIDNHEVSKKNFLNISGEISQFDEKKDFILHLFYNNIWNLFSIFEKKSDGVIDCFCFSSHPSKAYTNSFCFNNLPLLQNIIDKFLLRFEPVLEINKPFFAEYQDNLAWDRDFDFKFFQNEIEKHFQDFPPMRIMSGLDGSHIQLTQREWDCVGLLAEGQTAKEVARSLDISPRTVECYLKNSYEKTGWFKRSQLVKSFLKSKKV
jgi:DNA-binding CsgD family transcriptional regulator